MHPDKEKKKMKKIRATRKEVQKVSTAKKGPAQTNDSEYSFRCLLVLRTIRPHLRNRPYDGFHAILFG